MIYVKTWLIFVFASCKAKVTCPPSEFVPDATYGKILDNAGNCTHAWRNVKRYFRDVDKLSNVQHLLIRYPPFAYCMNMNRQERQPRIYLFTQYSTADISASIQAFSWDPHRPLSGDVLNLKVRSIITEHVESLHPLTFFFYFCLFSGANLWWDLVDGADNRWKFLQNFQTLFSGECFLVFWFWVPGSCYDE